MTTSMTHPPSATEVRYRQKEKKEDNLVRVCHGEPTAAPPDRKIVLKIMAVPSPTPARAVAIEAQVPPRIEAALPVEAAAVCRAVAGRDTAWAISTSPEAEVVLRGVIRRLLRDVLQRKEA